MPVKPIDIRNLFDEIINNYRKRTTYSAVLGHSDPTQGMYLTDSSGTRIPDYVWAQINFGDATKLALRAVRCRKIMPQKSLNVMVAYNPLDNELEVVEEDAVLASAFLGDYRTANAGPHAWAHGINGPDPLYIRPEQFSPLLVHPTNTPALTVTVEPYHYRINGVNTFYAGEALDLSSYLPANDNQHKLVIVTLDMPTNTLEVFEGVTKVPLIGSLNTVPFSNTEVKAVECGQNLRLAAIRLYGGQTTILWSDFVTNLRPFVTGAGETDLFHLNPNTVAINYTIPDGRNVVLTGIITVTGTLTVEGNLTII